MPAARITRTRFAPKPRSCSFEVRLDVPEIMPGVPISRGEVQQVDDAAAPAHRPPALRGGAMLLYCRCR
jgi:hypothetical protein